MITYIKRLIELRTTGVDYPCLFDSSNINCLFGMLDVSGSGYISFDQYKSGTVRCNYGTFQAGCLGTQIHLPQFNLQCLLSTICVIFSNFLTFSNF